MALFDFLKKKKKRSSSGGCERIVVEENSLSTRADGYHRLKDNVLYINADGNKKVIQIESSIAHEGKTTVACNLAVALGLTEKKVVIVDLDFRKPRVQQRLGVSIDVGIAEYMLGTVDIDGAIKHTKYKNVDVITRGGRIYNSSLILVSDKFKVFIKELRDKYDYVILDCAPILQVSDFIHISQVSDGVLFLVAYGQTTRNQVSDAVKELKKSGAEIFGTVFTMYDRKKDGGYDYYGKGYYGQGYYQAYLEDEEEERLARERQNASSVDESTDDKADDEIKD